MGDVDLARGGATVHWSVAELAGDRSATHRRPFRAGCPQLGFLALRT